MSDPRYPIGPFQPPTELTLAIVTEAITALDSLPAELRAAVAGLDESQLNTRYREGGWTARQVVHHVADSHLNAYLRHKLTVTEDEPTIRAYDEAVWAECAEARTAPVEVSLALVASLHVRWTAFLRALHDDAFARAFSHPEAKRTMRLDWSVAMYAWHGRHHVGHIRALRSANGW